MKTSVDVTEKACSDGKSELVLAELSKKLDVLTTQHANLEQALTHHFQALMSKIDAHSMMVGEPDPSTLESLGGLQGQTSSNASRGTKLMRRPPWLELEDTDNDREDVAPVAPNIRLTDRLRRFVQSKAFDSLICVVIVLNMLCMGVRTQLRGMILGHSLGFGTGGDQNLQTIMALERLEVVFFGIYWVEMSLRAWVMRMYFFRSKIMVYELCAVLLSTLDNVANLASLNLGVPSIGPILRMTRLLRLGKILRVIAVFPELNIFLTTIKNSAAPLGWGILLLFTVMGATSLLASELLWGFIEDESEESSLRSWAFEHFGTMGRSMLTMLESTFSPKWTTIVRTFATEVSILMAALWMLYGVLMSFAAIRLVGALFVKTAMSANESEQHQSRLTKRAKMQRNAAAIHRMFKEIDSNGDGKLERSELEYFLQERVDDKEKFFDSVDLHEEEAWAIFDMAGDGDSGVDIDDFILLAMSMRNPVQTIDTVRILKQQDVLRQQVEAIAVNVGRLLARMGNQPQNQPQVSPGYYV